MTERLQLEINDVRKRLGIEPSAEDIIALYEACNRCDAPFQKSNLALIGAPVEVGGVNLWPLTIGASIWLDEYAFKWWGKSNTLMHWALVFAFVKGYEQDVFIELITESKAHKAIKETCLQFACNEKELENAIDQLTHKKPITGKPETVTPNPDWERVISELELTSGIPADVWLWGKSASYTARTYLEHRKILSLASGSQPNGTDALDDAITALAMVKRQIWINHNE